MISTVYLNVYLYLFWNTALIEAADNCLHAFFKLHHQQQETTSQLTGLWHWNQSMCWTSVTLTYQYRIFLFSMMLLYFTCFQLWFLGTNNKTSLQALIENVHWTQNGERVLICKREFSICLCFVIDLWCALLLGRSCLLLFHVLFILVKPSIPTVIVNVFYNVCNFWGISLVPHFCTKLRPQKAEQCWIRANRKVASHLIHGIGFLCWLCQSCI